MNNFTPFPASDDALRDLSDFLPIVWEAMDSAVTGAASFFPDGVAIDTCLFPNLVRYYAKQFFENRHLQAEEEESTEFDRIGLANNGLCVVRGRYAIRIRKSDNGLVPVPGSSQTLQQFYKQQPLPFNLANRPIQIVDTSLMLLWEVDAVCRLVGMELSCPRAGTTTRSSVELHWSVPLVNPMATANRQTSPPIGDLEGIEAIAPADESLKHG